MHPFVSQIALALEQVMQLPIWTALSVCSLHSTLSLAYIEFEFIIILMLILQNKQGFEYLSLKQSYFCFVAGGNRIDVPSRRLYWI